MDSGVKNVFNRFSVKQIVCSLMAILSLLLFFILTIWSSKKIKALDSQQAAARWDAEGGSAQVSCFFSEEVTVDEMQLTGFKLELEKSLKEVLETVEKYNNGSIMLTEEVVECQRILRESEVIGEEENGNVYVLRYSEDGKLYALSNFNTGTLKYISTYDEYYDSHIDDDFSI